MNTRKEALARKPRSVVPADYPALLDSIKQRIRAAQVRAAQSANSELIALYWDIGRAIHERQQKGGWGTGVIPRLARDLRNELPELKGFSERNLGYMIRFYREYPDAPILQQLAAKIPWFHHIILLEKIEHLPTRLWYMEQTLQQGWSRNTLVAMIHSRAHDRQGKAVTNFAQRLSACRRPSPTLQSRHSRTPTFSTS